MKQKIISKLFKFNNMDYNTTFLFSQTISLRVFSNLPRVTRSNIKPTNFIQVYNWVLKEFFKNIKSVVSFIFNINLLNKLILWKFIIILYL